MLSSLLNLYLSVSFLYYVASQKEPSVLRLVMWEWRHCQGITPIWYLYAMASVQLLQVINTSFNFPIYWFVGNFRETFMAIFCTWGKKEGGERRDQGKVLFLHQIKIIHVFSVLSQWDTRQSILSISNENTKLSFISNDQRRKISADLSRDSKFDLSLLQNKVQTQQKPYRNM